MSFTFNTNIPAAPNYPGNDQPKMLINNQSTSDLILVDHVGFNNTQAGKHNQVTFRDQTLNPSTGASEEKIWNNGNALYYRSQNNGAVHALTKGGKPVSPFQAYASIQLNASPLPPTLLNSYNVSSITLPGGGIILITFTTPIPEVVAGTPDYGWVTGCVKPLNPSFNASFDVFQDQVQATRSSTQLSVIFSQAGNSFLYNSMTGAGKVIGTIAIFGGG